MKRSDEDEADPQAQLVLPPAGALILHGSRHEFFSDLSRTSSWHVACVLSRAVGRRYAVEDAAEQAMDRFSFPVIVAKGVGGNRGGREGDAAVERAVPAEMSGMGRRFPIYR